ncbi:hypothetical protein BOTBODRAFT_26713 [Botryobasidium botryosum FD-172 SS1]|uniref:Fork-head domain-containing protein n=1 Tax=Botryobasidium botryosum (strain FD-172 SS1) TaxID=930990 RepID=A0A067MYK3_BOTB1|nr:hypothetical protein BOTBODRAFT_26713 [Botryobasidium botryosum FD-172 SS1]
MSASTLHEHHMAHAHAHLHTPSPHPHANHSHSMGASNQSHQHPHPHHGTPLPLSYPHSHSHPHSHAHPHPQVHPHQSHPHPQSQSQSHSESQQQPPQSQPQPQPQPQQSQLQPNSAIAPSQTTHQHQQQQQQQQQQPATTFYPNQPPDSGAELGLAALRDSPGGEKPVYPYSTLIRYAIKGSPQKRLLLEDIYYAIEARFSYFRSAPRGWKNSVRHNLSLNPSFEKVPRPLTDRGKGSYWTVNDDIDPRAGVHRVRRRRNRSGMAQGEQSRKNSASAGNADGRAPGDAGASAGDNGASDGASAQAQVQAPAANAAPVHEAPPPAAHSAQYPPASYSTDDSGRPASHGQFIHRFAEAGSTAQTYHETGQDRMSQFGSQYIPVHYSDETPTSYQLSTTPGANARYRGSISDEEDAMPSEVDEHGNPIWRSIWLGEISRLAAATSEHDRAGASQEWYRAMVERIRIATMPSQFMQAPPQGQLSGHHHRVGHNT